MGVACFFSLTFSASVFGEADLKMFSCFKGLAIKGFELSLSGFSKPTDSADNEEGVGSSRVIVGQDDLLSHLVPLETFKFLNWKRGVRG